MTEKRKILSLYAVRTAVIIIGVLFVVLGVCRGEPDEILAKAVRICLECIGLG